MKITPAKFCFKLALCTTLITSACVFDESTSNDSENNSEQNQSVQIEGSSPLLSSSFISSNIQSSNSMEIDSNSIITLDSTLQEIYEECITATCPQDISPEELDKICEIDSSFCEATQTKDSTLTPIDSSGLDTSAIKDSILIEADWKDYPSFNNDYSECKAQGCSSDLSQEKLSLFCELNSAFCIDSLSSYQLEARLNGNSYTTVRQKIAGETENGTVMGHWRISFKQGECQWYYTDIIELCTYTVPSGNTIQVQFQNRTLTATYNGRNDIVTWDSDEYELAIGN